MGAALRNQAELAGIGAVQGQVFAEQGDCQDGLLVELGGAGDRVPVAAQQRPEGRARPEARQALVDVLGQHGAFNVRRMRVR